MARKIFIAGNWKMNKTAAETAELASALKASLAQFAGKCEIAVCPTFTSLATAVEILKGSNVKVGAQNIHWADNGAYTGEISGAMLKEIGVEYVIIGHSERRQYFGETDETVNQRIKAALKYGLKPIVCIGETLAEREGGVTNTVLEKQIRGAFADIEALIRDTFVDALPLQPLCRPDCKGLCPQCGVDLNEHPEHEHKVADMRFAGLAALKEQLEAEEQGDA